MRICTDINSVSKINSEFISTNFCYTFFILERILIKSNILPNNDFAVGTIPQFIPACSICIVKKNTIFGRNILFSLLLFVNTISITTKYLKKIFNWFALPYIFWTFTPRVVTGNKLCSQPQPKAFSLTIYTLHHEL